MVETTESRLSALLADAITTATAQGRESIFLRPSDAAAILASLRSPTRDGEVRAALRAWLDSHGEADIEERLADAAKEWLDG